MSPTATHKLWRAYAVPRLTYGLKVMTLTITERENIEKAHRKILKQLQGLPTATASTAVYTLIGTEPISITLEKNIMTFFVNIARKAEAVEYAFFRRSLLKISQDSSCFASRAAQLLGKYSLPTAWSILEDPPKKLTWKRMLKSATNDLWKKTCEEYLEKKSSLRYLQIQDQPLYKAHNIWASTGTSPRDVKAAEIKARLATSTYNLQCRAAKFNKNSVDTTCLLSMQEEEDISHFLLRCQMLESTRIGHMQKIEDLLERIGGRGTTETIKANNLLLQLLLDPTSKTLQGHVTLNRRNTTELERLSRNLCYSIHLKRAEILSARGCV